MAAAQMLDKNLVKRPSRLWGWLRGAGYCFQMTLVYYFVNFGVHAYIARTKLQAALADMDRTDPGWRLPDIEAARAVVPDAENSALRVIEANKLLPQSPKNWIEDDFDTELQHLAPERRMSPAQFAHLRDRLDEVKPALDKLKGLNELPNGRFPITYAQNPLQTMLPEQNKLRRIIQLLVRDSMAYAEAGEPHQAVESCRRAYNAGRSVGDEPIAVTQLIRVAGVIIASKTAERILAQTEPSSDDLKRLQELVEKEDAHPYWTIIFRGDRGCENAILEAIESGAMNLSELSDSPPEWTDHVLGVAIQEYIRGLHPQLFLYSERMKSASELPARLRKSAMEQIAREARSPGLIPVTLFFVGYPKLEDWFSRGHAALRCLAAAVAAERYRRLHGDWPESLEQLTPDLIAEVPIDPFTGDPLLYHHLPDGVVIYSVSSDGVDNGGVVDAENPTLPGADLGVRLWDVAERRQPPALPAAAAHAD
jgi:hypothetical protein